ncbi:MAG: hypothetical protein ACTSUJ_05355 [Candidatus Njordarchaeales archaeon]
MRILLARLGWSSFDWKGLPETPTQKEIDLYSKDVKNATMEFIRENGYGGEWWNFDERFCRHFYLEDCDEGYYYGNVPRGLRGLRRKLRDELMERLRRGNEREDLIIIFVSRDPTTYQMKLVGIYCDADFIGDLFPRVGGKYKDTVFTNLVSKANIATSVKRNFWEKFTGTSIIFKAPKKSSLAIPENARVSVNMREVFGVFIGAYLDVEDVTNKVNYNKLLEILNEIKAKVSPDLASKLEYILSKIEEVKEAIKKPTKEELRLLEKEYLSITNSKECADALCEIAELLGLYCQKEYPKGTYRVDVVWKKVGIGEPFLVFEILHKGDPEKDVSSLQTMCEKIIPGAKPVWIVHPSRVEEAQKILEKRLLSEKIILMDFNDVAEILTYLRKLVDKLSGYGLDELLKLN